MRARVLKLLGGLLRLAVVAAAAFGGSYYSPYGTKEPAQIEDVSDEGTPNEVLYVDV